MIFLIFPYLLLCCQSYKLGFPKIPENCNSPESAEKCENKCENDFYGCLGNCEDSACNGVCQREVFICLSGTSFNFFSNTNVLAPNL